MGYSEARGEILDVLIHDPDQTNMSLTLRVNQQAEDRLVGGKQSRQGSSRRPQQHHLFLLHLLHGHLLLG